MAWRGIHWIGYFSLICRWIIIIQRWPFNKQMECTCLTPEVVLKTSGHVDKFTDLMVCDGTLLGGEIDAMDGWRDREMREGIDLWHRPTLIPFLLLVNGR